MGSNTSNERAKKGSKFWMQTLVNLDEGAFLAKRIREVRPALDNLNWLSPLREESYKEYRINRIGLIDRASFSFWPYMGPVWDGIAINETDDTVVLVEAKAHVKETLSKCRASSIKSINVIKQSLKEAHDILAKNHTFNEEIWFSKYYQLGNRLAFLTHLNQQGFKIKLLLLNIVNDSTHIRTTQKEWDQHYEKVFKEMLGMNNMPHNVGKVDINVD